MIAIIDYDAGNLKSVEKALQHLGEECKITRDVEEIATAEKVILPGVGAFQDAMEKLEKYQLADVTREVARKGTPLLGLQLLFESSEEGPGVQGLGILPGRIVAFPKKEGFKIPHMGWNSLKIKPRATLFRGLGEEPYVYFVHSYYLEAAELEDVAATTDYITTVHASVERGNVYGCQFHPEKSGDVGLQILRNFCQIGSDCLS